VNELPIGGERLIPGGDGMRSNLPIKFLPAKLLGGQPSINRGRTRKCLRFYT